MSGENKAEQIRVALRKWLALRDEADRLHTQRIEVDQRLKEITKEGEDIYNILLALMGDGPRIVAVDGHAIAVGNGVWGHTTLEVVPLHTLPP